MLRAVIRGIIVSFGILLQLGFFILIQLAFYEYFAIIAVIYEIISILIILFILKNSTRLSNDLPWIILILILPIFGTILLITVGRSYKKSRLLKSIFKTEEDYKKLDLIIVGHHKFVKAKSIKDQLSLFFRNNISKIFPVSKKKIEKNTNVYIQALKKYKINILSHINRAIKVDVLKVALAAKEAGTLVELNGKGIFFTDDEMLKMAEAGVKFILDSDAHSANRVGEVDRAISLITRLNIPRELIVNLDQLPNFDKEN